MSCSLFESDDNHVAAMNVRAKLAKDIMGLFDQWQTSVGRQLSLLGIEDDYGRLNEFSQGDSTAFSGSLCERCGYLLSIRRSLLLMYPDNPVEQVQWMNRQCAAFGSRTPLDMMCQDLQGLIKVDFYLRSLREEL